MTTAIKRTLARFVAFSLALTLVSFTGCGSDNSGDTSSVAASKKPTSSQTSSKVSEPSSVEPIIPEVNDYSERTYKLPEITDYLKINGRWATTKTSAESGMKPCISFDHSAMMLAFNADCEGDVTLNLTTRAGVGDGLQDQYFLVEVDGVETRMTVTGKPSLEAPSTLTLATGLKRGNHTFKVYRQTELNFGICNLVSLTMKGVPTERPADKELYIEFLGDSITAGYGNLTVSSDGDKPSYPAKSSGTDTYAFVAAKQLDADMYAVARSGLAFVNGLANIPIEDYWNKVSWARTGLGDYKAERQPDVVVINLGTNDDRENANWGYTTDQLRDYAVKVLETVRANRPDAKIVWYYGMMGSGMQAPIKQAITQVGGEEKGFYYLGGTSGWDGGGGHPSKAQHQAAGQKLANYISEILK